MLQFLFFATLVMLTIVIGLPMFKSETVTVDPKNPNSPQYPYRLDELALLKLALDDIVGLEQGKDYRTLYDHASKNFRSQVPVRNFLEMSDCVEQYLGPILNYDRDAQGFSRRFVRPKGSKNSYTVDSVTLKIARVGATVEQRYDFVNEGLYQYRLADLNWTSKNKQFQACIDLVRAEARKHAREAKLQEEERQAVELQEQQAAIDVKAAEEKKNSLNPSSEGVDENNGSIKPLVPSPTPQPKPAPTEHTEPTDPLTPVVPQAKPEPAAHPEPAPAPEAPPAEPAAPHNDD